MKSKFSAAILAGVIFLAVVWGSAFILMKVGRQSYDTWQLASLRLSFAGMLSLPVALFHLKKITLNDLKYLALAGVCGNGIPAYLFAYAGNRIPSSLSGSLNALTPLFTLVVGIYIFAAKINKRQLAGILIGLLGALLLIFTGKVQGKQAGIDPLACFLVIAATLLYGINVNIIRHKLSHLSAFVSSMLPLTIIAIPSFIIALASGAFSIPDNGASLNIGTISIGAMACIAILGLIGNSVSLIVFNLVIKRTSAIFAASITYLVPFIALCWGLFDHETISLLQAGGLGLILGGIAMTR